MGKGDNVQDAVHIQIILIIRHWVIGANAKSFSGALENMFAPST